MRTFIFGLLTAVFLSMGTGCAKTKPAPATRPVSSITVFSGPNMRTSMEELGKVFESRTGTKVIVESDEIRVLIDRIQKSGGADLFVTHDPFLNMLVSRGIAVVDSKPVASLVPTIVVVKGNPKHIAKVEDLAQPGLRVALTEPTGTLSGHIIAAILRKAGIAEKVEANVVARTQVGREIAAKMVAGEVDAGIVWNAVIAGESERVEGIAIDPKWMPKPGPESIVDTPTIGRLELDYVRVSISTLSTSKMLKECRDFEELVASAEGAAVFAHNGFTPADPARPALIPGKPGR